MHRTTAEDVEGTIGRNETGRRREEDDTGDLEERGPSGSLQWERRRETLRVRFLKGECSFVHDRPEKDTREVGDIDDGARETKEVEEQLSGPAAPQTRKPYTNHEGSARSKCRSPLSVVQCRKVFKVGRITELVTVRLFTNYQSRPRTPVYRD